MRQIFVIFAFVVGFFGVAESAAAYGYCPYPLTEMQCQAAQAKADADFARKQDQEYRNLQNQQARAVYQQRWNELNGSGYGGYDYGWQPRYDNFRTERGRDRVLREGVEKFAKGFFDALTGNGRRQPQPYYQPQQNNYQPAPRVQQQDTYRPMPEGRVQRHPAEDERGCVAGGTYVDPNDDCGYLEGWVDDVNRREQATGYYPPAPRPKVKQDKAPGHLPKPYQKPKS